MNQPLPEQHPIHIPAVCLARLAEPHSYRCDCDEVHLQARFMVQDQAAHQKTWALQLWACPSAPSSVRDLDGQLLAEVALPPLSEIADDIEHMDMSAFAVPPAADVQYFMVLVLAAGRPGQFDEVHDLAVYLRRQRFFQPRMRGSVGYHIDGDRVTLSVEQIENPRSSVNMSGTLALELWALSAPYAGGAFKGVHLAGVDIGSLSGQTEWNSQSFELPFSPPPSGDWNFVLMLREWTAAGYITRDFTNFPASVTYGSVPSTTEAKTESSLNPVLVKKSSLAPKAKKPARKRSVKSRAVSGNLLPSKPRKRKSRN